MAAVRRQDACAPACASPGKLKLVDRCSTLQITNMDYRGVIVFARWLLFQNHFTATPSDSQRDVHATHREFGSEIGAAIIIRSPGKILHLGEPAVNKNLYVVIDSPTPGH